MKKTLIQISILALLVVGTTSCKRKYNPEAVKMNILVMQPCWNINKSPANTKNVNFKTKLFVKV